MYEPYFVMSMIVIFLSHGLAHSTYITYSTIGYGTSDCEPSQLLQKVWNTTQNSSANLQSYPPDNHHCMLSI